VDVRPVITLSSVPPRFGRIGGTLASLAAQRAEAVRLYIPRAYRRFPEWDGRLPEVPPGVEVVRCEEDWGPATKLLGALAEFSGQDLPLLLCDDDQHYPEGWAARFAGLAAAHPGAALAMLGMQAQDIAPAGGARALQPRARRRWRLTDLDFQLRYLWQDLRHWRRRRALPAPGRKVVARSGYADIFEGRGGVLVRPGMFGPEVFDVPAEAWTVDDVWLSANLARRGVPIWVEGGHRDPTDTEAEALDPLCRSTVGGLERAEANRRAVEYLRARWGVWP
jgi:hypothetical protein